MDDIVWVSTLACVALNLLLGTVTGALAPVAAGGSNDDASDADASDDGWEFGEAVDGMMLA